MEIITDEWGRKKPFISSTEESIGPFFSNPSDSQLLFSSPSLSPPILSTIPHLTPAHFLTVSGVPPSSSSTIESSLDLLNQHDDPATVLSFNRLQFLPFPDKNSVLVFFPTGSNLDQVGFLLLSTGDSTGDSGGLRVMGTEKGGIFVAKERFHSRILKILVQPFSDLRAFKSCTSVDLGYIMVYSLYSVHWYCVKSDEGKPVLRYLGVKQFKRCLITSFSWHPHLPGECLVLLENGEVFLFDLNKIQRHCRIRGSRLNVFLEVQEKSRWLGCEFGWRRGMFIIACSTEVVVINKSSGNCNVRSLVEVKNLNMAGTEEFVGFAKAGSDGFRFILASHSYVYLCDERSEVPLLKWQHDIEKPCFMDVYSLSELGFRTVESTTFCVVIGSFWNAQSQMFCYGPSQPSSLHVWELPHNLLVPAGKCLCGDCVFKEVMMMESLPEWIDWQKKSVLVLGFGVLNKYLPLESSDQYSGFTLIRLTSSGKLEAIKFGRASRLKSLEVVAHRDSACKSDEVNLLYLPDDDDEYDKRFKYLELEYLSAHTKGMLAEFIDSKMRIKPSGLQKNKSFSIICHEELCKKLKICGFGRDGSSSSSRTTVFENINSPTSVYDIALSETWSSLPIEVLLLAFSNYSEFEDVLVDKKKPSLEFSVVPELPQLPPFFLRKTSSRSTKWSKKEQPSDELVGPLLPLPVLMTLPQNRNRCFKSEQELSNRCNQISEVTRELANSHLDKTTISLDNNRDNETRLNSDDQEDETRLNSDSQKEKQKFIAYSPITKTTDSDRQEQKLTTFVSRIRPSKDGNNNAGGRSGLELFDDLSPVDICFDNRNVNFDTKALLMSKTLLSQWQQRSTSYQDFLSKHHLRKGK